MAKLADTRFECREFSGTYGVLHRLKTVFKGGKVRSEFILAFDSAGNIVRPAVLNLSLGFCPIQDELSDIEKFVKSNKPLCYKVGEFTLLGRGALIFDEASGEVIDSSDFRLYVPKDIKTKVPEFIDNKGNFVPVLFSKQLVVGESRIDFGVSQTIYDAYMSKILSNLSISRLKSKEDFLRSFI